MNEEQRRFQRIDFDARIQLDLGGESFPGVLRDISLKGALVVLGDTGHPIREGDQGHLTIRLDEGSVEMKMEVTVAYFHPVRHACGLSIQTMDVETASHLRRLIEVNLGDEDALQRELNNLIDVMESEHGPK